MLTSTADSRRSNSEIPTSSHSMQPAGIPALRLAPFISRSIESACDQSHVSNIGVGRRVFEQSYLAYASMTARRSIDSFLIFNGHFEPGRWAGGYCIAGVERELTPPAPRHSNS